MKILITTPSLAPHGGIRNIVELANRLNEKNEVTLYVQSGHLTTPHFKINCRVVNNTYTVNKQDLLIISSPHAVDLLDRPQRKIVWVQMIEHLFRPDDIEWLKKCKMFYENDCDKISTATWGLALLKGKVDVLGTGVSLTDFPILKSKKDNFVLLESPEPTNPAKDVNRLAIKAGKYLKQKGFRILGYGALPPKENIFDSFHVKPSLAKINEFYSLSSLLIKATKYDFRSTACLEAMTKGCVTVRAIDKGDEDLNESNSFLSRYNEAAFMANVELAISSDLEEKTNNCIDYIKNHSWDYWFHKYEKIICG